MPISCEWSKNSEFTPSSSGPTHHRPLTLKCRVKKSLMPGSRKGSDQGQTRGLNITHHVLHFTNRPVPRDSGPPAPRNSRTPITSVVSVHHEKIIRADRKRFRGPNIQSAASPLIWFASRPQVGNVGNLQCSRLEIRATRRPGSARLLQCFT